jgi:hypothetical protein
LQDKEVATQILPSASGATASNLITFEDDHSDEIENKLTNLNLNIPSTSLDISNNLVNNNNLTNEKAENEKSEEEEYKERLRKEQEDFRLAKYLQSQEQVTFHRISLSLQF